jgi:hypothetical protein
MKITNNLGHETNIITDDNIYFEMSKVMYLLFDSMLKEHYNIDAEDFKEMVKNHFPEKHI